jgi:hypothetical protein
MTDGFLSTFMLFAVGCHYVFFSCAGLYATLLVGETRLTTALGVFDDLSIRPVFATV